MSGQFKCRFCSESFHEVLGFLDHFETHMNQDSPKNKENEQQISSNSKIEEIGNDICGKGYEEKSNNQSSIDIEKLGKKSNYCQTCEIYMNTFNTSLHKPL